jgi:hypothetical protein
MNAGRSVNMRIGLTLAALTIGFVASAVSAQADEYHFLLRVPVHLQNLSPEVERVNIQCAICASSNCPGIAVRAGGGAQHTFLPGEPRELNETFEIPISVTWPNAQYNDLNPPRGVGCKLLLKKAGSGALVEPDGNGGWNSRAGPDAGPYHPTVDRMIPSGYYPP